MLITLLVADVAAALKRRSVQLPLVEPCDSDGMGKKLEFETALDSLSWEVSSYGLETMVKDVTTAASQHAGPLRNESGTVSSAAARIEQFFSAAADKKILGVEHSEASISASSNLTQGDSASPAQAYCAHHIPVDSWYWPATEQYHITHPGYVKCEYSDGCKRPIRNMDRVTSLRNALKGTSALLKNLGIKHMLYGGSAIGQYRCGDVLPWDVDCDVLISSRDVAKLHQHVFNDKSFWSGRATGDLASLGAPGIVLHTKTPCCPFEIVDTQHGFFCDVFVSDWKTDPHRGFEMYTPWWNGRRSCPGMFPQCEKAGGGSQCYAYPQSMVSPVRECTLAGSIHGCPAKMYPFLEMTYGPNVHAPNRTITS